MVKIEPIKNNLYLEINRLETFISWPFDDKSVCCKQKMAEAGFYWCGNEKENDTAACYICEKVLDGWEANDDPWYEHEKHAPQCPFINLRKSEKDMTVADFLTLLGEYTKNHLQKIYARKQQNFEKICEKQKNNVIAKYKT